MPLFVLVLTIVLGVGALLIFSIWGIPVVIIALLMAAAYFLFFRAEGGRSIGVIERGKRVEPTGRLRKASGGAQTANERVGHP